MKLLRQLAHNNILEYNIIFVKFQFSKAVQMAYKMTNSKDTLIVVTADHAHTMSISGYSTRGTNILGLSTSIGDDNLPYTTLSYANGPSGFNNAFSRVKLHEEDVMKKDFEYPSIVPLNSETHGADDVAVHATGPKSHLFTGTYEQNVIPHIMAYISGIEDHRYA